MNKKMVDRIVPILVIAVCVFLYINTYQIPEPRFEPLGSAFFPRFILIGIICLSIFLLIKQEFFAPYRDEQGRQQLEISENDDQEKSIIHPIGTIFLLGLYILLISITDLPYLILTFLFTVTISWFLSFWRFRAIPLVLATAIGVTVFIYFIFGLFLDTFFP